MSALGDYLAEAGRKPRKAGEHDCATFPAGWAMLCGHADPMARWRGAYDTEEGALALAEQAGGLVELFGEGLSGLSPADDLRAGDIGVIRIFEQDAGAIFTGARWAVVADRGLAFAPPAAVDLIRAWRP